MPPTDNLITSAFQNSPLWIRAIVEEPAKRCPEAGCRKTAQCLSGTGIWHLRSLFPSEIMEEVCVCVWVCVYLCLYTFICYSLLVKKLLQSSLYTNPFPPPQFTHYIVCKQNLFCPENEWNMYPHPMGLNKHFEYRFLEKYQQKVQRNNAEEEKNTIKTHHQNWS